ncbi:hypothetical protein Y1Q_0012326 [Alligator mississippiensis]|uniref:Uncharacterized protein n=1 Tax=Alligator mississippiensis TaxID=8496 RepID=A0A151M568_ALLMI|nr:hypothetical protein Y1Q_0012326 [Alligator mississippiensis]
MWGALHPQYFEAPPLPANEPFGGRAAVLLLGELTLANQEPSSKDGQADSSTPSQVSWPPFQGLPRVQERHACRAICLLPCGHFRPAHTGSLAESPKTSAEACVTPDPSPGISETGTSWGMKELPRPLVKLHPAGPTHCSGAWQGGTEPAARIPPRPGAGPPGTSGSAILSPALRRCGGGAPGPAWRPAF